MQFLENLFKKKWPIWLLVSLPMVALGLELGLGEVEANPVEIILFALGGAAVKILVVSLWISPLRTFFPKAGLPKEMMRHRRMLGVSAFVYAALHFGIYLVDSAGIDELLTNFTKIFILSGFAAFLILLALAITSTNGMVKRMGFARWKKLHRGAYLAGLLLFLHMIIKEKGESATEAVILFVPLALAQAERYRRHYKSEKAKQAKKAIK